MLSASVTSFGRAFHRRVPSGKIPRWYAKVCAYGTRNWALLFLLLADACMMWSDARMSTRPWTILYIMVMRAFAQWWQWHCWFDHSPGMCRGRTGVVPSLACLRLGRCGGPKPHRSIQGLGGWGIHICASSLQLAPCVGCAGGRLEFRWPSCLWHWRVGTKMSVYGGIHQGISQCQFQQVCVHASRRTPSLEMSFWWFVAVGISVDGNSSSTAVPIIEGPPGVCLHLPAVISLCRWDSHPWIVGYEMRWRTGASHISIHGTITAQHSPLRNSWRHWFSIWRAPLQDDHQISLRERLPLHTVHDVYLRMNPVLIGRSWMDLDYLSSKRLWQIHFDTCHPNRFSE